MASLFYKIWPFSKMKICLLSKKLSKVGLNAMPNKN